MKGKGTLKEINQASQTAPDQPVIGSRGPLPSAGLAERPREGKQAQASGNTNGSAHDCVCSSMTDHSPLHNAESNMALSVTRHALNPELTKWKIIQCGIDTLDVGLYVDWDDDWEERLDLYDARKVLAFGTDGILIKDKQVREHLFLPSGKAPNYRYHLQFPEYHLYIGISQTPKNNTPNLYASINSETIWSVGIIEAVKLIWCDLHSMGCEFKGLKPSRCDICVDIHIPGGLSRDFIESLKVSRSRKTSSYMNCGELETFYSGAKAAPVQVRIYNKGIEIKKKATEQRWLDIWGIEDSTDIWRIEFQVKRVALNQYKINTFFDLENKIADLWRYLTEEWFSLRYPDNEKAERRTFHPLWAEVQKCSEQLGQKSGAKREYPNKHARHLNFYINRIAGLSTSIAALEDKYDQETIARKIYYDLLINLNNRDFQGEIQKKQIKYGVSHVDWKALDEKLKRGNA